MNALAMSWILTLAACGGGGGNDGGSPPPGPATSAEGLWIGSTSTSRSVTGIVLDDGTYWILYAVPHFSSLIAGVVQGTGSSLNGSFSSSDGIDFNLEGQGINGATVSASYAVKQSFNGSVTYSNPNEPFTFTSSYNTDYDQTPSASAIAGTYIGIASVAGSNEAITIVISSQGAVAGTGGTSGCQYLGAALPRAKGNLYDLSVVIGGGACSSGTSAVTGIGYFNSSANRLYVAALNKSRTNGLIFVGIKS
ncbi:MAG: hypothetical protein HY661_20245 [Betaproteobacteria bacterium]|nr:hypothetical protein [Betaproteobacteria bacterium]